jgi:hypothetical protein
MNSSDNALEREFSEYVSMACIVEAIQEHDPNMLHEFTELSRLAKSSSSTVKELLDVYTSAKNADLHRSITKLDREMAETERLLTAAMREADTLDRDKLALERENAKLKEEIEKLKLGQTQPKLLMKDGLYYQESGEGPFCPNCYVSHGVQMPLTKGSFGHIKLRCTSCKSNFG